MEYVYKTRGTCSTNIELNVEDGVVKEVVFWGGCNGNLQGISRLVRGMKVVAGRLHVLTSCVVHCTRWDINRRHLFGHGLHGFHGFNKIRTVKSA